MFRDWKEANMEEHEVRGESLARSQIFIDRGQEFILYSECIKKSFKVFVCFVLFYFF